MNTTIDSSLYLSNQQKNRAPSAELGKDEFIKILMTQLQNQDPLNPMEDKDFISQMATFSSLEQTMNMADAMDRLVKSQSVSPVIQFSHMIGKEVTYREDDEDSGEKKEETSKVIAVSQKDDQAILELENGRSVHVDHILKVEASTGEGNE